MNRALSSLRCVMWLAIGCCLFGGVRQLHAQDACCIEGECRQISPVFCNAQGGVYLGPGSTCANDGFRCDLGACCTSTGCQEITLAECGQMGGVFETGASCSPGFCGACCTIEGNCLNTTQERCLNMDGAEFGAGVLCSTEPCGPPPFGACCDGEICFESISQDGCESGGGVWAGPNTGCVGEPGPCQTGACCVGGSCVQLLPVQCAAQGGAFFGGVCSPTLCVPPGGACCAGTNCIITEPENCSEEEGRIYLGDGTTCEGDPCGEPNDPTGACCTEDRGCLNELTAAECSLTGGYYAGNNSTCESGVCDLGACCRGSVCTVVFQIVCVSEGSDFVGAGSNCDEQPCGAPPTGACCRATGECQDGVLSANCAEPDVWLGPNSTCESGGCNTGACCLEEGCEDTTQPDCQTLGGFFISGGSCAGGACNNGACCSEESCVFAPPYSCFLAGRDFVGAGVPCDPNPCVRCECPGDANGDMQKNGADIQQMVDCLLNPDPLECLCADMDESGGVDLGDVGAFVTAIIAGGSC